VLAHLFKRALFAGLVQSESHLDDLFLPGRQSGQRVLSQLAQIIRFGRIRRIGRTPVRLMVASELWSGRTSTIVPRRILEVQAAANPRTVNGS
jgi:hypothetical protein